MMRILNLTPDGGEAKSLFLEVLQAVGGSSIVGSIADSLLVTDPRAPAAGDNDHSTHMFKLRERHIGVSNEVKTRAVRNIKPLKGPVTTAAAITARAAHDKQEITFMPKTFGVLLCNLVPFFDGKVDQATIRRIILWVLTQRF